MRRGETGFEWACGACGTWNLLDTPRCAVCGAAFAASGAALGTAAGATGSVEVGEGRFTEARRRAWWFPGLGQWYLGDHGSAIARMILSVVWLVGAALVASAGAVGVPVALPLLFGALGVWLVSVDDVRRRERGSRALLDGRVLLWLVVAVTILSLATLLVAAIRSA